MLDLPKCLSICKTLLEDGVGEKEGGVGYAEVEIDAPDNGELSQRYVVCHFLSETASVIILRFPNSYVQITSVPTLLAFSRGEAQLETKVTNAKDLSDQDFLKRWIEQEAARGGQGGAGGKGLLGRLFGSQEP